MPASDLGDLRHAQTSPGGAMYRSSLAGAIAAMVVVATPAESVTASTYAFPSFFERTASGPDEQIESFPSESAGEAVLEMRRRSGLTWEELGELFEVSRRSLHHWASGRSASAEHERKIWRMLASIRRLDQGDQTATRARLLAVDEHLGVSVFDLWKQGRFEEAGAALGGIRPTEYRPIPLSRAVQDARRPPAPVSLLEAVQDRPEVPAKARTVRAARVPKKTG